jgi:periplasmic protein TonB
MGPRYKRILATTAIAVLAATITSAQVSVGDASKRKVKYKTNPQYPALAHRMLLSGTVKIEVVIAADGHVKNAHAIGGHPLLIESCLDAVKDWKFEPAPADSTEVIDFEFK